MAETGLDFCELSGIKPMQNERHAKATALHMRLPAALLEAVKQRTQTQGVL